MYKVFVIIDLFHKVCAHTDADLQPAFLPQVKFQDLFQT